MTIPVAERLREERSRLGLSQKAFGALGGVSKNTQLNYESGATPIPLDYLTRLEKSGLDVTYVTAGIRTSEFLRGDRSPAKTAAPDSLTSVAELGLKMIPEVDIAYSMGGGASIADLPDTRMVPFRADWLDRLTRGFKADVFLTRGEGDSMMPTILDDDDVLVNRADNVIRRQDRIWAIGYGELGMIKRVRRLPSGQFQLNSDNPAVSPIEATEDELYIVGRVIWIGRRV